ncbi:uncharacterized protein MONOS_15756 [Monocercomonoides exilis]|uniref:uncharacterized protein n=1 Tax=Monocercomonoides exilis TaxID=2049356 RepID=UPI00355A29F2|nr:hypothetical protein MONOS_15756 [Monocercomonoides exilis]|eukprot:MONOS_15756.1-p1 / transcript=MONOS_15756.1 / gene=MONOS_15756 / organism=Monocercomonoides_exilis_PA203 / gene_product=unspecified product / transcript_product=unspecified product / location=Mono_scaffold01344:984-1603(+) / protein_length=127 / sequence_SO=supercontig / SO=protein_coding / is_pseudo=false
MREKEFKVIIEARRIETFAHTSASSSTSSFVFSTGIVIGTDDIAQLKAQPQEDIPTDVGLQACGTEPRSVYSCLVVKHVFQPLSMQLNAPAGIMISSFVAVVLMGRVCGEALHPAASGQLHCTTIF